MRVSMSRIAAMGFVLLCLHAAPAAAGDASVRYVITNGGTDVGGNGQTHYVAHGKHDGPEIVWAGSGDSVRMPQGTYDVHMSFSDGAAHKEFWIDNQTFTGTVEKTVEIGLPVAEVRYTITNGGVDVQGNGQTHFVPHGHHDGPEVAWSSSGDTIRMLQDVYDVHVSFSDGAAHKEFWIDNQSFAGKVDKTVEIGMPVAEVRYAVTNNGEDVRGARGDLLAGPRLAGGQEVHIRFHVSLLTFSLLTSPSARRRARARRD